MIEHKRILIVTEHFGVGGLETQVAGMVSQLTRRGWKVYMLAGRDSNASRFPEQLAGSACDLTFLPDQSVNGICETTERIERYIRECNIDLIHAHPFLSLLPAFFAAHRCQKPFAMTLHGPASVAPAYGLAQDLALRGLLLPHADAVFCVSEEMQSLVAPYAPAERRHVLLNGVDVERFAPPEQKGDDRWAIVSRIDAEKLPGVIDFCRKAVESGLRVEVVGSGPAEAALRETVQRFPEGRVHLRGESAALWKLLPSYAGVAGMGRVALEASAMNLPAVLVGYDGVKGLLDESLAELAALANLSGRGLPTISQEDFSAQLQHELPRVPERFALRDWVLRSRDERAVWAQYEQVVCKLTFTRNTVVESADRLFRAARGSSLPFTAKAPMPFAADLHRDLLALVARNNPAVTAAVFAEREAELDRFRTQICEELTTLAQRAAQHSAESRHQIEMLTNRCNEHLAWQTQQTESILKAGEVRVSEQIRAATDELSKLIRRQTSMQQTLDGLQSELQQAHARLAEFEERDQSLKQEAAAAMLLRESYEQAIADAGRLRQEVDKVHRDYAGLHEWVQKLDAEHGQRCAERNELQYRLDEITRSTGWRFLQAAYRVRFGLFPRGSYRERAARWMMHMRRRAAFHARQGPGAFLAAGGRYLKRVFTGGDASATSGGALSPVAATVSSPALIAEARGKPLVSVILPVYNQANLLRESILSVLNQTYNNFELIVVNDGSNDGVEQVFDEFLGHPKVRLLTQANQKLPKALSNAFDFASGELWTWTSADNLMEPRQLERQVQFLQQNPAAAMVYCDYLAIDDRGEPLLDPSFRPHNRRSPQSPEIHLPHDASAINTVQDNFIGACFMYRGWIGRLLGEYAPNLGVEDYDYWMRLNRLFGIHHIGTDEVLYRYRVHDNTLNARAAEHRILERVRRLMQYEQERAAFYAAAWTIYADQPTREWLAPLAISPHELRDLAESCGAGILPANPVPTERPHSPGQKVLILATAEHIAAMPEAAFPRDAVVIAWSDGDETTAWHVGTALQQRADAIFAAKASVAQRYELWSRRVFCLPPGEELLKVALALANNDLFYRRTTPATDRARMLPRVYCGQNRRLRVLLQVENFMQGGLEQVVIDVASVLDRSRFDLAILALGRIGVVAEKARRLGLEILQLPETDRETAYRTLLRDRRIDLINAHYAPWGGHVAREIGLPFVQTVHNSYIWLDKQAKDVQRAAEPLTSAYLCVSTEAAGYAERNLGFPAEKIVVVQNGVDIESLDRMKQTVNRGAERARLGWPDDAFVFLQTASLYAPKGQHLLIGAMREAVRRDPRIHAALLGKAMDERYAAQLHAQAKQAGIADHVHFLGYHDDPQRFYSIVDAFVLPSFVEGWSLALAEAIYARLPIIATKVGSAGDLLPRVGGILLEPPFDSILDIDIHALYKLLDQPHPELVAALADAMVTTARDPRPPKLTPELARSIDRRHAYQAYGMLYEWLVIGGTPAAARPWLWELHGVLNRNTQEATN